MNKDDCFMLAKSIEFNSHQLLKQFSILKTKYSEEIRALEGEHDLTQQLALAFSEVELIIPVLEHISHLSRELIECISRLYEYIDHSDF